MLQGQLQTYSCLLIPQLWRSPASHPLPIPPFVPQTNAASTPPRTPRHTPHHTAYAQPIAHSTAPMHPPHSNSQTHLAIPTSTSLTPPPNLLAQHPDNVTWHMMLSALPALHVLNVTWQITGPAPTMQGSAKTIGRCRLGPEYDGQVALTLRLPVGMH